MTKFHAEWSKKFFDVFAPPLQQWNLQQKLCITNMAEIHLDLSLCKLLTEKN